MYGHNRPFTYSPGGFSQDDFPQQRRPFLQDDVKGSPLQRNNMSRPNGKSIYMQRKEYSETLNKHSDNFRVRVEHLFTCELDGQELKTVDDCMTKLKTLDNKGRLWPQEMIMEVLREYLLLSDIETKTELESHPLSSILQTRAVPDSCAYNSVLTITLQERNKRFPQVLLFQCEETRAEHIKSDLDKAVQKGSVEPHRDESDIRNNLESILGQHALGNFWQSGPRPVQRERTPSPLDHQPPQWREPENMEPPPFHPQDLMMQYPDRNEQSSPEIPLAPYQMEGVRNKEIFNHVLDDLEIFMDKVSAATSTPSLQKGKSSKKNAPTKKKSKNKEPFVSLPHLQEYISCLQKVKYGFNLLGQLDGILIKPSAEDFVHIIFTSLDMIVPHYPADVPPTVVSPLLTVAALRLLDETVSPAEDQLLRRMGDSWNLSRSRWPDEVPPYIPEFYDGWQPPPPFRIPSPLSIQSGPISRSNSHRYSGGRPHEEPVTNGSWGASLSTHEPPQNMRVIYDSMARSNQELTVLKGEVVQVILKSKQWWLVRNNHGEEGKIPPNVLEPMRSTGPMEGVPRNARDAVTLDMTSTSAEVKAWLEHKGFSRITVSSLGVLPGKLLLGMTKTEIRTVCPEEGAKVFFQLQAVKSAIALNSEPSGLYNGR